MKTIIQKSVLFVFLLFITNSCGNSVINPPKPTTPINPLVGFLIAEAVIAPYENLQFATCEGAEEVKIGDTKTANVAPNSMKFFKLTNTAATDYVYVSSSVTSGSSFSGGSSTTCMFVGKEDQLITTNSSSSTLDYPASTSTSCTTSYSFEITKDKFRCIGVASLSNISISLQITQTTSSAPASVSSISPLSGPVGTLVTITGKNLGRSGVTTSSVYFGSSTSAKAESSGYSELKVRVPEDATTGSIKIGTSSTSVGTFTLTTPTMMTRSTPVCTFTSINGSGGTIIGSSTFGSLDEGSVKQAIGFTFTYFGVAFDSIYINTNGGASFLSDTQYSSAYFSNTGFGTFLVAPWWGNLALDGSSSIQYSLTGTTGSRVFTVEWVNYPDTRFSASIRLNFQVKLYEGTNLVEFIYGNKAGTGSGNFANIGIKNGIGGTGNFMDGVSGSTTVVTSYNSNTTFPALNTCYRFTP
jgi:hypothetical protein